MACHICTGCQLHSHHPTTTGLKLLRCSYRPTAQVRGEHLELSIIENGHLVTAAHERELVSDQDGGTLAEGTLDGVGEHVLSSVVVNSPARKKTPL